MDFALIRKADPIIMIILKSNPQVVNNAVEFQR